LLKTYSSGDDSMLANQLVLSMLRDIYGTDHRETGYLAVALPKSVPAKSDWNSGLGKPVHPLEKQKRQKSSWWWIPDGKTELNASQ
jgi:hypothetical protein